MKKIAVVLLALGILVGCEPSRPVQEPRDHPHPTHPAPSITIVCGGDNGTWRECLKHMNDGY